MTQLVESLGCKLDKGGKMFWSPAEARNYSVLASVHTGFGDHPSSTSKINASSFSGGKEIGAWKWSSTSTYCLGWYERRYKSPSPVFVVCTRALTILPWVKGKWDRVRKEVLILCARQDRLFLVVSWLSLELVRSEEDRQWTYNVIFRHICATIVAMEKIKYNIFRVCVFNLRYPARNAQAPYFLLWRVRLYSIPFPHYLINCTIFEKKLFNVKCLFRFFLQLSSKKFLILRRNEQDVMKIVHWYSRQVAVLLVRFYWNLNFLDRATKSNQT
jgi:hypothetical protein